MKKITFLPLIGFSLLTSCTSLSPVNDDPKCSFVKDNNRWFIQQTPTVHREHQMNQSLTLHCQQYKSETKPIGEP